MDQAVVRQLLEQIQAGRLGVEEGMRRLASLPFEDLGFARLDHHRSLRCGFPEVIYCPGKTAGQVVQIAERLLAGGGNILATRAEPEVFEAVKKIAPAAAYNTVSKTISIRQIPAQLSKGCIGVICAGTADVPIAEEARETAVLMDQRVETFYDVGVAGLHRLLAHLDSLRKMNVLVVVAGMEGALASVVGGLVQAPVIAVPTSVGYGASLAGLAPLLTMLNSCAAGVAVVNIDNGFGAGYTAALINRLAEQRRGADDVE